MWAEGTDTLAVFCLVAVVLKKYPGRKLAAENVAGMKVGTTRSYVGVGMMGSAGGC